MNEPQLISVEDTPQILRYLSWQALGYEFMCGIVARGIPLAPTRDIRRALMHQTRTENSQAAWLVGQVEKLGGSVEEQDESLLVLQRELTPLCDQGWLEFLVCGQVALRAYMEPYLRAQTAMFQVEEEFGAFTEEFEIASREVMIPEISAHFKQALYQMRNTLTALPPAERAAALDTAKESESKAFEIFKRFIALSYDMLEDAGVNTAVLGEEIAKERDQFWDRLDGELQAAS
jgi:hypothetical protein